MIEHRRFHRVRFRTKCELNHQDSVYLGHLENISLNGALVSFDEGLIVHQGADCSFVVYLDGEDVPLRFNVEVIHSMFTMIGITFAAYDAETKARLYRLIDSTTTEPERLKQEMLLLG